MPETGCISILGQTRFGSNTRRLPGHCVASDTAERFRNGVRRYFLTLTNLRSRFSVAAGTCNRSSNAAQAFLELVQAIFPYKIDYVLADGSSEFQEALAEAIRKQPDCAQ